MAALALQAHLDHVRAFVVVVVELLTVEAVDALMDVDYAVRVDGGNRALMGATLARCAAFRPALEPVEHAQPTWDREGGTQGAHIAAEEAFDE